MLMVRDCCLALSSCSAVCTLHGAQEIAKVASVVINGCSFRSRSGTIGGEAVQLPARRCCEEHQLDVCHFLVHLHEPSGSSGVEGRILQWRDKDEKDHQLNQQPRPVEAEKPATEGALRVALVRRQLRPPGNASGRLALAGGSR